MASPPSDRLSERAVINLAVALAKTILDTKRFESSDLSSHFCDWVSFITERNDRMESRAARAGELGDRWGPAQPGP